MEIEMKKYKDKNNRNCKIRIKTQLKKKQQEKNKQKYLNIIHQEYFMKEIDMYFWPLLLKIVFNLSSNSQMW